MILKIYIIGRIRVEAIKTERERINYNYMFPEM